MMYPVVLSLGTNMGDRMRLMGQAVVEIGKSVGRIVAGSSIYETDAWGLEAQAAFLNQVLLVETSLSPEGVLDAIQEIEKELGRVRLIKWGARTMDIDILFYDDRHLQTERLRIPHPFLPMRKFILVPLNEVLPLYQHPVTRKTAQQMLAELEDPLKVKRVKPFSIHIRSAP